MTFQNIDGVLIIDTGTKMIASTSSHVIEKDHTGHVRLTFGAINVEFEDTDISIEELAKLLPR